MMTARDWRAEGPLLGGWGQERTAPRAGLRGRLKERQRGARAGLAPAVASFRRC
jgi:hypothetical protein